MTGRIRNFSKPSTEPRVQIVGAPVAVESDQVQILDSKTPVQEETQIEYRVHEETITEDSQQVRREKRDPKAPEVRVRDVQGGAKEFEKVKRLEDE
jgi:hypothetical protein